MPVGNLQGPVLPFSLLEPLIGRPKIKTPTRRLYQEVGSCEQRVKRRSDHMTYCLKEAKPQSESIVRNIPSAFGSRSWLGSDRCGAFVSIVIDSISKLKYRTGTFIQY